MSVLDAQAYRIYLDEDFKILESRIAHLNPSKISILLDENTVEHCLPIVQSKLKIPFCIIQIPSGEEHKNIATCNVIWQALLENQMDRNDLLINLGGGVIGDMGGFVASTYKRGIQFIQAPTTLLAQVDASIGGKLGVDLNSQKNMIGLFNNPESVFIYTPFLKTLEIRELKSGFAEIIKHALITSRTFWEEIIDYKVIDHSIDFNPLILTSLKIKNQIVNEDPYEKGLRKILNFGHTIGHAIESTCLMHGTDIRHGEAIAAGMICESHISHQLGLLNLSDLEQIANYLVTHYGKSPELIQHSATIVDICRKDKKNTGDKMLFTLLKSIGESCYNNPVDEEQILASLGYYSGL